MTGTLKRILKVTSNIGSNIIDAPIVVLLYHRVARLQEDFELLTVSPDNFDSQIAYIKSHYPVLRFDEDWSKVRTPAVVITFDDGYADNYHNALPILEKHNVPATFFVTSGILDVTHEFWWDELGQIILDSTHRYPEEWIDYDTQILTRNIDENRSLYQYQQKKLKSASVEERRKILDNLIEWSGKKTYLRDDFRSMDYYELKQLHANNFAAIGSHTLNHVQLSALDYNTQFNEISEGHNRLGKIIGAELNTFSYPFGAIEDYNLDSLSICKTLGFKKVAANYPGQYHRWSDNLQIPRKLVRNWDMRFFKSYLKRAFYL
ncbi:MAG: polysaccharide deacetylase family protein [Oscillospiraceae bacterium]|nr:polysaccharide deacetylase family protein [Oscillospiraceae bacterium]